MTRYPRQRQVLRRTCSLGCVLVLALLLLGACSSGLQVRSDEDPSANFGAYKTFNFFDPMGIEGGYNSAVYGEHFRSAISREMQAKGYRLSNNPDLLVNVTFKEDEQVRVRAYTRPYMSGYYYNNPGGAYYGSGVGVGVGVGSRATKITEASVFIDLVDTQKNRVSWQGVMVVESNDKVAQALRDAIYTAVNEVYKLYPHQAGQG